MNCSPTGNPSSGASPQGTEMAAAPARDVGTVHTSDRYMASGSLAFSPILNAAVGDQVTLNLGGREVLSAHGDFIYNRNPKYSAYRRLMRFGTVRGAVLSIPAAVGKTLARGFRGVSRRTTPLVNWTDGDLLKGAEPHFAKGVDVLICGHIHRPAHLECERGGRRRDLYVVGDWGGAGECVEFDGSRWTFKPALG